MKALNHKKAGIYPRVSKGEQRDNYSEANQRKLHVLAEKHGFSEWEYYDGDLGISGETIMERRDIQRLLDDVADGRLEAIVCQDFSRLSRDEDMLDGLLIKQICRNAGCLIITPEKVYDFGLDSDDFASDVQILLAKTFKRQGVSNMVRGLKEKASQGDLWPSVPPMGYDQVDVPTGKPKKPYEKHLVINPTEAKTISLVYDLYEKMSRRQVARELNRLGYRKPIKRKQYQQFAYETHWGQKGPRKQIVLSEPRTERLFVPKDIKDILSNRIYEGFLVWGRKARSRHMHGFEAVAQYMPELQIISHDQFKRCQDLLRQRERTGAWSVKGEYVFSGVLRCPWCGGKMMAQWRGRKVRKVRCYVCRNHANSGDVACPGFMVYESVARDAILPFLVNLLTEKVNIRNYVEEAARAYSSDHEHEKAIRAEIIQCDWQLERLVDAIAKSILTPEMAKHKIEEISDAKSRAQARLQRLSSGHIVRGELARAVSLLKADMPSVIYNLDTKTLKKLVHLVLHSVTIEGQGHNRKGRLVEYEFVPEFEELVASVADLEVEDGQQGSGGDERMGIRPLAREVLPRRTLQTWLA
jgi:hypothetical protein